jgi:hypothetical protein
MGWWRRNDDLDVDEKEDTYRNTHDKDADIPTHIPFRPSPALHFSTYRGPTLQD